MAADEQTEKLFRDFESNVLDKHHETLPLWGRERSVATYSALAQFDCFAMLALSGPPNMSGIGHLQTLKGLEEGLSEALRWLHPGDPHFDLTPTDDRDIIGEAGEYCAFAKKYVDIADLHKMYGRGQVEIEVNEAARRVRFVTPKDKSPAASMMGMSEQSHQLGKLPVVANPSSNEDLGKAIFGYLGKIDFQYASGQISLPDVAIANDPKIKEQLEWALPKEALRLDPGNDLVGFSVGDFETFFDALRRWSFCCTFGFLHSITQRGKQQWECAPTQCVERLDFVAAMIELTGLSDDTVEAITERLTYDRRTKWPEVFQQPLFCGQQSVAWSASIVQGSKSLRNMLKLMSRTKKLQNHAATLIGSREDKMLSHLGSEISKRGKAAFKLRTPIAADGEQGEVDLLAYNLKFPDELLVVEGKALLGVDEINEVDAATKEMQSGQDQLSRVIRILSKMSDEEKSALFKFVKWNLVKHVFGVVVAGDAEPNDKYDHTVFPGISLQTIEDRLRGNHLASPKKFWRACRDRRWMDGLRGYSESYRPIKVGDVTYELPSLVEPTSQAQDRKRQELERVMRQQSASQREDKRKKKRRRK